MNYIINTEIGLMGLWDLHALDFINDETYKKSFIENSDISKLMNDKKVVVFGVGGDGRRPIEVRINPENDLTDEEIKVKELESSEYKLSIVSGEVVIGSPEWSGDRQSKGLEDKVFGLKNFKLENGDYKVKIYFVYFDPDNEAYNDKPEFIVCIKKLSESDNFNPVAKLETLA